MSDTDKFDEKINIIASTAEQFTALSLVRRSLPFGCKEQIESIGYRGLVLEIRYRPMLEKLILPSGQHKISHGADGMRVCYDRFHILVPWAEKRIDMDFVGQ